jgi:hypothetical protein
MESFQIGPGQLARQNVSGGNQLKSRVLSKDAADSTNQEDTSEADQDGSSEEELNEDSLEDESFAQLRNVDVAAINEYYRQIVPLETAMFQGDWQASNEDAENRKGILL